ncbi:uncharacterized protein MONBRDRAFT_36321 [Monosiga brevicollis MX1]|uniref:DNA ligase D polymerase domain-containing protein n=1 Tax=Monosiga brevicollis TaxID=81824 RepID=A9UUX1_MONBE|nr:uncharacterized protein MONBRDRAFT_36321 [Monosiga brevicollis MX1]EDQ90792.1 predicted protein [Monosiga brevicollis MX1]|eukprot:XP_001744089.1 hypothetical protein [Monosiga brevicollis MX1]
MVQTRSKSRDNATGASQPKAPKREHADRDTVQTKAQDRDAAAASKGAAAGVKAEPREKDASHTSKVKPEPEDAAIKAEPREQDAHQAASTDTTGKDQMFGIRFTHPNKVCQTMPARSVQLPQAKRRHSPYVWHRPQVMFPDAHLTKAELAKYFLAVDQHIIRYTRGRPLTLVRGIKGVQDGRQFVRGIFAFAQGVAVCAQYSRMMPHGKTDEYMEADSAMALVSAVQMDSLEFHAWLSTSEHLDSPGLYRVDWHVTTDKVLFNLDPIDDKSFGTVKELAFALRDMLSQTFELKSFVMLTGGDGLHVVVPLTPDLHFDDTREFAKFVGDRLAQQNPDKATIQLRKDQRGGRVLIDYMANTYNRGMVVPYSTRARSGAPVACPVTWAELQDCTSSKQFDTQSVLKRLESTGDIWKDLARVAQKIPKDYAGR